MIKKTISFSLIVFLFLLTYQFLVNLMKNNHYVTYTIDNGSLFNIDEKYIKENGKDYYLLKVTNDDKKFAFKLDNYFNKQKNIVSNIVEFEQDDYYCIGLKFVGNRYYTYPECIKNGVVMSYASVKDKVDFGKYLKKIIDKNIERYSGESSKRLEEGLVVNKDYLDSKEALLIYNYKTMSLHYYGYSRNFSFANYDNYKNDLGTIVGKYYVMPRLTTLPTISTFIKYDIVDGISKEINLPVSISKQSYINGVYDNKLYLFDKSDKRQYEIDPYNDDVKIVGTTEEDGKIVKDGKLESISVYDLDKSNEVFTEDVSAYSNLDYDKIYVRDDYAIFIKNNAFYKVYKDFPDIPIYLFTDTELRNIKVLNENVYYVKNDSIYKFNQYGSFVLATRNEFIYNYDNIFDIHYGE